jgi:diketogulonate reductase-like aldo/keto reductase
MASSATYRHLTAKLNTGFDIPLFGLGTYKITGQRVVNDAVDAALGAGYRLFDTAKLYNNEKELGVAFEVRYMNCIMTFSFSATTTKTWFNSIGHIYHVQVYA